MSSKPVFRFAPSPNGELHLGHAYSAITGHEMAQRLGGRFLLRIEDIDLSRCRQEYVTSIYEDLAWLGISWEEPVLRQSRHFADYEAAACRLKTMGILYPCFASRMDIAEATRSTSLGKDPDGAPLYPYIHKNMPKEEQQQRRSGGEAFALRIDMERAMELALERTGNTQIKFIEMDYDGKTREVEARPERWGDAIIVRKDIPASYALSVVVDDHRQGVTHVCRGQDLFPATDLQRLLHVLLDIPAPIYHHHRLILDDTGRKLSKSARDISLRSLRHAGFTPRQVRQMVELG